MLTAKEINKPSDYIIIDDMTSQHYHSVDLQNLSISSSMIRSFQSQTPACFYEELKNPKEPSNKAFSLGSALHAYIFQKEKFLQEVVIMPKKIDNFRTKEAQQLRDEAFESGRVVILHDELETIKLYEDSFKKNRLVSSLIDFTGKVESSIFINNHPSGMIIKARPDYISKNGIIIDYKSTESAEYNDFKRSVIKYGYFQQAAWYLDICKMANIEASAFVIIAQEKKPPYPINVFVLSDDLIEVGRQNNKNQLEKIAFCYKNNNWPAYPENLIEIGYDGLTESQKYEIQKNN